MAVEREREVENTLTFLLKDHLYFLFYFCSLLDITGFLLIVDRDVTLQF